MLPRLVQPPPICWEVSFIQGLEWGTIALSDFGVARIEKCAQVFWGDWTIDGDLCEGGNPMYAYLACLTIGSKVCAFRPLTSSADFVRWFRPLTSSADFVR